MQEKCIVEAGVRTMGDTNLEYDEGFGMNTFKREICAELGVEFWNKLTENLILPDMETEAKCQCCNMSAFMEKFDSMTEPETANKILARVRHGVTPSQSAWAREEFLKVGDLDKFLEGHLQKELAAFEKLYTEGKDFYGDEITEEVLEFLRQNPMVLAPVRKGSKLYMQAFPANMKEYLSSSGERMKRYYACHCPFAKESILSDAPVSDSLCSCSLGHVMNFAEAFLDRELNGRVLSSALKGDMVCTYEVSLPDDIMEKYVKESPGE
ncbi:hypothetical protein [Eisenbergiella sp.]